MKKIVLAAVAASLALPVGAIAHDKGSTKHRNAFLRSVVIDHEGARAPGRDIVNDGVTENGGRTARPAKKAEIADYLDTLRRLAFPPPIPVYTPSLASSSTSYGTAVYSSGAGGELASIKACESGGNYATDTGNGYYGAFQFDDATWKAAGGSTEHASQASPEEQDRVAAHWIASGHRGAWPNC